jgi:prolipoprotein diacylglyceryltransferase
MVPILGTIGPVTVYTHDVFTLLALAVGLGIYYRELQSRGMLGGPIIWISLTAILFGAIGARIITAWEHLEIYAAFADRPFTEVIERSGKSILGGLAGGYLGIVLAKRAFGYTRSTGDCYALAIPVATAVGRVGCFLSELPLGTPTTMPWGMSVSPAAAANFAVCPGCGGPMHPSMLYEIAFNIVAAAVIVRYRHLVPVQGDTLKLYLLAAGVFRFLVEFVRGNEIQALGLTGPQLVLIPLVGLLLAHFVRQVRRGAYRVPAAPVPAAGPAAGQV